jgi:glucose-6-phosphate isomerase
MAMELPDEAISYDYRSTLVPVQEDWTPAAELRAQHLIPPQRLKDLLPRLNQCRSLVVAEREAREVSPDGQPLQAGFIDLPQHQLDQFRRKGDTSVMGQCINTAQRLREDADTVVFLGTAGSALGARALFQALRPVYHNELSSTQRLGIPRAFFAGDHTDNDALQDLLDMIQLTCVDPERREERWAVVVANKSGSSLEPAIAQRLFRREAAEYYGSRSEWLTRLFVAITGPTSKLRDLFTAAGHGEDTLFPFPDNVGSRFGVFTAAGLLPAALLGLDVRALLLGAAAMTRRFLEEPFDRNPVLQYAAVNYLLAEELGKPLRVLSVWSPKLAGVGYWYDSLVSESLSRQGRGPTPLTCVQPGDLDTRGQQFQEGPRDRVVNNLLVQGPRLTPIALQMADRNEDDLNQFNRKKLTEIVQATHQASSRAYFEAARPTADLILPGLTEHALGQLLQMLMLATVVEGRLMGINPYGQPGVEVYQRHLRDALRATKPALAGHVPSAADQSTTRAGADQSIKEEEG